MRRMSGHYCIDKGNLRALIKVLIAAGDSLRTILSHVQFIVINRGEVVEEPDEKERVSTYPDTRVFQE
jgi:hypothetical protein